MPSPLILAQELRTALATSSAGLHLLDCRFQLADPPAGEAAYREGHLPGAVYAHLERDLSGQKRPDGAGGRHPLPDPGVLASWLGEQGIGDGDTVVAYDDPRGGNGFYAARAWWLLCWLGCEGARVLDGGLPAWLAAGGELTTLSPRPVPARLTPRPRSELLATAQDVGDRPADTVLIDSRAPARYRGEVEPIDPRAGHIPGAVNRDWAGGLDPAGRWRPAAEQAGRLGLGDRPAIFYCGSGVSAAANLLALAQAGREPGAQTRLYAGSWSDWLSDPARPVELGEG